MEAYLKLSLPTSPRSVSYLRRCFPNPPASLPISDYDAKLNGKKDHYTSSTFAQSFVSPHVSSCNFSLRQQQEKKTLKAKTDVRASIFMAPQKVTF